jgi:integrase
MNGSALDVVDAEIVDAEVVADVAVRAGAELDDPVAAERYRAYRADLDAAVKANAKASVPKSTTLAFAQDWSLWAEHLAYEHEQRGVKLDPVRDAVPSQFVAFVLWLDKVKHASPTSMPRRLTGIRARLRDQHGVNLTPDDLAPARKVIRSLTTASGNGDERAQKAARAERLSRARGRADIVTPDDVRQMVEAAPKYRSGMGPLPGLRVAALAALSFGIAARTAETSALYVADIVVTTGTATVKGRKVTRRGLMVDVPAVKGGTGRQVFVPESADPERCPVRLWKAWAEAAELDPTDAAFPAFAPNGQLRPDATVSAESIRTALTDLGALAELPQKVTGHSFRRGFITQAQRDGMPHKEIARQSGHSLGSPEFWKYIELADLLDTQAVL